jgi:hypothetical protein
MSKSKFTIEKNVPMPVKNMLPDFPLDDMEIGDSFVVNLVVERDRSAVRQRLSRYQQRNPPKRFSAHIISENVVRVHRVHDYE